ncbi:transposase [bacterium]|nr:transposase [bacterium]
MRLVITNAIGRELVASVAAAKRSAVGAKPKVSDRQFLEAVLYRLRTGTPWQDLPAEFGDWNAASQRFKRWRIARVRDRLFGQRPASDVRRLFVDSTNERAHFQPTSCKKEPRTCGGSGTLQRRLSHQNSFGLHLGRQRHSGTDSRIG